MQGLSILTNQMQLRRDRYFDPLWYIEEVSHVTAIYVTRREVRIDPL